MYNISKNEFILVKTELTLQNKDKQNQWTKFKTIPFVENLILSGFLTK